MCVSKQSIFPYSYYSLSLSSLTGDVRILHCDMHMENPISNMRQKLRGLNIIDAKNVKSIIKMILSFDSLKSMFFP